VRESVHWNAQSWKPCIPSFSEHVLAELHGVSGGPVQVLDGSCREGHERLYDNIKEGVAFRRKWAERCGFGFELPSVVPNVPKTAEKAETVKAA
jgi:hypothetical protein